MFSLHHIGILVDNIDAAIQSYRVLLPQSKISDKIFVSTQRVHTCFLEIPGQISLELIEPADEESVVYKLKKKGFTYYHLGYYVDDFEKALELLAQLNFKQINIYNSERFDNKQCSFFMSTEMHLIEIIEK
jgi:catechol 2,3-dioxygenase-like lactoylglutathione lyase family enzyme